jgi:hypothetical protein
MQNKGELTGERGHFDYGGVFGDGEVEKVMIYRGLCGGM